MRVLKPGRVESRERHRVCHRCDAEFTYTPEDVKADKDGPYVNCPCCKSFIYVDIKVYTE